MLVCVLNRTWGEFGFFPLDIHVSLSPVSERVGIVVVETNTSLGGPVRQEQFPQMRISVGRTNRASELRPRRKLSSVLHGLLVACSVLLCGLISAGGAFASPPTTALRYFYDAEGHLKALYNPASETALYGWDEAGNLLTVAKKSSSVLSITELAPTEGPVGERVTI